MDKHNILIIYILQLRGVNEYRFYWTCIRIRWTFTTYHMDLFFHIEWTLDSVIFNIESSLKESDSFYDMMQTRAKLLNH